MTKNVSDKIFLSLFKNKLLVPWYSIDSDTNTQQRNEDEDNSARSLSVEETNIRNQLVDNRIEQGSTAVDDGSCAQVKEEKRISVKQEDGGIEFEQMKRLDQDQGRCRRFTPEEKKELSLMRFLMRKRQRQREKEMTELEAILRKSGDFLEIYDDPEAMAMLAKRTRGKCNSQREKYPRIISEERTNSHRQLRQISIGDHTNDSPNDIDSDKTDIQMIQERNAKRAEISRIRYHRMSLEEKKDYNRKRTETSRRRRMKEVVLLSTPTRNLTGEQFDKVQGILARKSRQNEAAKLHYQRKKTEKRKVRSKKRSKPTSKRRKLRSYAPIIESSTEDDNEDDDTEGTLSEAKERLCHNESNLENEDDS